MNRVEAVYENGVFRPIQNIDLEEGAEVDLFVKPTAERDPAEDLSDIAIDTGIPDLATNIDYYLYGLPKQG